MLCYAFFCAAIHSRIGVSFPSVITGLPFIIEDTLIVQHRDPGPVADVFEWGAIRVFLCSSVIEYLVPVGEVCIRIDLCQTFIGWNDKIIRNDNGVGFACVNQIGDL